MRMDHLQVAVDCHGRHERNAGRSIDGQHVQVHAAPNRPELPVVTSEVGVDAEGHAEEEQEVSQTEVKEEGDVGFPELHTATEDPQREDAAWQPHQSLDSQENDHQHVCNFTVPRTAGHVSP